LSNTHADAQDAERWSAGFEDGVEAALRLAEQHDALIGTSADADAAAKALHIHARAFLVAFVKAGLLLTRIAGS
jgi:hypothetical protein